MTPNKLCLKSIFAVILALMLLALNIAACFIPSIDVSGHGVTYVSSVTKDYLSTLNTDVEIFVVKGELYDSKFERFIEEYARSSDRIKLEFVEFEDSAEVFSYAGYSAQELGAYAVVVKSDKRADMVDYYSLFYYATSLGNLSYSDYYNYYTLFSSSESYASYFEELVYGSEYYFYGEAIITALVEYAALDIIPRTYLLCANGEDDVTGGNLAKALQSMSYDYAALDLGKVSAIPQDAGCIVINDPDTDYSDAHTKMILDYMKSGGRVLLVTGENASEMKNLSSITEYYGAVASGMVAKTVTNEDGDETESFSIAPTVNTNHDAFASFSGYTPVMKNASSITVKQSSELRASQLVTPILTSPSTCYVGEPENTGEYPLGIAVEEIADNGTTRMIWFTGADSFNGEIDTADTLTLLIYSLGWLSISYESAVGNIEPVLYGDKMMNVASDAILWWGVITIVATATLIGVGAFVYTRRKKA